MTGKTGRDHRKSRVSRKRSGVVQRRDSSQMVRSIRIKRLRRQSSTERSSRFRGIDRLTKERRSWNMSRIRGKNTNPEKIVRSLLHRMGYRFRLHGRRLPGRPDIVLPKYRTVIFVHGCFWHRHKGCKNCTTPTRRREWWVTVRRVVEAVAVYADRRELKREYPELEEEDIREALAYAAANLDDEVLELVPGK